MKIRKIKLFPHKMGSQGCKVLARALGCRRVFKNGNYRPKRSHLIINWGNSSPPEWYGNWAYLLNHCVNVINATDKEMAFELFTIHSVPCPRVTVDISTAMDWGTSVIGREVLNGSGGDGIVYTKRGEINTNRAAAAAKLSKCKLFVEYIPNAIEYRIHIVASNVIDVQQKKKRKGVDANKAIKNLGNGWVYTRTGVSAPIHCSNAAITAVSALGLDFGAVDVLEKGGRAYVLEVNTAPGLEGATVDKYAEAFTQLVEDINNVGQ